MSDPIYAGMDPVDRSKQYVRASPEELLRSLNDLWKRLRQAEQAIKDRDVQIAALHARLSSKGDRLWLVIGLAGGQWMVILWLATELFKRIK